MGNEFPAWPFLLGGLVATVIGIWQVATGAAALGWILVALALALLAVGVRQGRRTMAATAEPGSAATEPAQPPATRTSEGGAGLSAYYENEAAVRSMQKETRRLCKECNSPVLSNASECPTCGTSL